MNVLNEYIIKLGVNVDQSVSRTIQGVTSSFKALGAATAKLCKSDDLSSWSKNFRNKWDNFNVNVRQQSAAITNQGKYIKGIIEQTMAVFWGPLKKAMDQNGVLDALPGLNALKMGRIKITKDLAELSRKIPINFEGLAKIAAEGLKIRVPEENITKYTELLGKFATAVNASSQVAATSMNTVFSAFGTSFEDFQRIADTVSFYQTRSRVSSEAFLETMGSLSGAARVAGLNEAEVAALSATWARITSLKGTYQASAEGGVSGKAFRELFKNLQDLTRIEADFAKHREINKLSTKDADKYSAIKLAGLDIKRLNTLLTGKNKIDAILYFLEQVMLQTPNARDKVLNVLFGKKLSEVSYKIAELLPELRENLALANKGISGFEGKTETLFQERVNGVKEQFALLQNRMASLGATIGVQFLPIVSKLLTYTTDFVNLLEKHSDILINILKGFLVFQGARLGLGVFKGLKNVWGLLKFVGVFVGRLNWIGLALTALGAVATAVVAKWDTVKSWFSKVGEWFSGLFGRKNKEKEGKENNKEGISVADIFRKESINSLFYGISDFVSKGWNWVSNLWKPSEENKAVQAEKYVEPSQVSLVEAISGKADTDTILANRLTPLEVVLQAMDDKLKTFLSILQTNQETRIDQKRQENEPINIILQINQNHLDGVMGDINNVTMLSPSSRFRLVG